MKQEHTISTCRANMWDKKARFAWKEHGLVMFHINDGRVPEVIRRVFRRLWSRKYGRRV